MVKQAVHSYHSISHFEQYSEEGVRFSEYHSETTYEEAQNDRENKRKHYTFNHFAKPKDFPIKSCDVVSDSNTVGRTAEDNSRKPSDSNPQSNPHNSNAEKMRQKSTLSTNKIEKRVRRDTSGP